ncbi:MAG: coenzyme F420-0:L-glutamate ligase [archaeon]|nr:MAG: coenzyme F420-0:L-glutamate ligase [archaeon]
MREVVIRPLPGLPEVGEGADIAEMIVEAARRSKFRLENGDVVVVKQKIVSKSEGRLVRISGVVPGKRAKALAAEQGKDPRLVELILKESRRVVRAGHGVIITETRQGLVCANAGIDQSNVGEGLVALLPMDADASARRIRRRLKELTDRKLAVVVTDTFGRPWRKGQTDVAIGCSGIEPLLSYAGRKDSFGYELRVTEPAVVDEIAGAVELAIGKLGRMPVAVVRGIEYREGDAGVGSMLMEKTRDLFR